MAFGLRGILLIVAIILFIVAALASSGDEFDYLAIGLACLAGALAVGEIGLGGFRVGGRRR